jgi:ABC-type multidrug transport system ATPase subunit
MMPEADSAALKRAVIAPLSTMGSSALGDVEEQGAVSPAASLAAADGGLHLRWIRIHKQVEMKPEVHGLLAAAQQSSRSMSFRRSVGGNGDGNDAEDGKGNATVKTILHHVSGEAVPGQVLATMGPSGSGKTSLMNVLSGRAAYQEGTVSVNGKVLSKSGMKRLMKKIAYVKQADIFFGHLTVRDQFTYTARLRLSAPNDAVQREVDRILRLLRLLKVADSPIMALSGGERKRVNIGTELLTDPQLILLDEPTSGLDSTSAVSLLKLLQALAREHKKTIITSIHQPSSSMFRSFDQLLMLSDGKVVYFGTPSASLDYLGQRGLPCPPGYNAADHWMDLLVTDSAVNEERIEQQLHQDEPGLETEDGGALLTDLRRRKGKGSGSSVVMQLPRLALQNAWDGETVAEQLEVTLSGGGHADDASSVHSDMHKVQACAAAATDAAGEIESSCKYVTSWWTQYTVLVHRALKNSRSAIFTPLNLCKSVAIGLVAGLLWFRTSYSETNVFDIRSYYFFTMTYWVFDSM